MSYPTDFFSYDGSSLSCEGVSLSEVAKKVGTPFYVYSKKAFVANYQKLAAGLKGLDHQICFAMKSNSNLAILNLLAKEGAGVDVVSGGSFLEHQKSEFQRVRLFFLEWENRFRKLKKV